MPLAEVGEPGGRRVDAVQLGQHVDRVQAQLARLLGRQRHVGGPLAAGDHAGDAVHGVEVAADDVGVVAEGDHRRDVVEDRRERRLDDVLAVHVVRTPRLRAGRRAPHDEVAAGGVAQQVGEVRGAAGELPDLRLAVEPVGGGGMGAEPRRDPRDVERVLLAHLARARDGGHAVVLELAGLVAHHGVVRGSVGPLEEVGLSRRLVGDDDVLAGVHARQHGRGDVVGRDLRALDEGADHPAHRLVAALHRVHQVGAEVGGADHARPDAVRRQLVAAGLGERHHRGLHGVVGAHPARVHETGERGDVDQVAGALLLEHRDEGLRAADQAEQVDVGDPLPLLERAAVHASAAGDAGVVHEHVEAAPPLADGVDRRRPVVVGGDVEDQVDGVGARPGRWRAPRRRGPGRPSRAQRRARRRHR